MSRLSSTWGRFNAHLHAWFVDHEVLRMFFRNFYRLDAQTFRSNHPSPRFIKTLQQRYGLKTIISLRKADQSGAYLLEKEACDRLGIRLINHKMSSCNFPHAEMVLETKQLFVSIDYPVLFHCKSGADRAGLLSVLYRHFKLGEPISEARRELSIKYGHFRWADTGKLDYFFDCFCAFEQAHPEVTFEDWVTHHYDRDHLDKTFKSQGWANIVVHRLLHRE